MSDDRPTDVLGALPHTRPHRRSAKRAGLAATAPTKDPGQSTAPAKPSAPAKRAAPAKPSAPAKQAAPAKASAPAKQTAPTKPTPAAARARTRKQGSEPIRQPAQPDGTPSQPRANRIPVPPSGAEILGTAVHAAAEIAEIGLTAGARALRNAIARLPRP